MCNRHAAIAGKALVRENPVIRIGLLSLTALHGRIDVLSSVERAGDGMGVNDRVVGV